MFSTTTPSSIRKGIADILEGFHLLLDDGSEISSRDDWVILVDEALVRLNTWIQEIGGDQGLPDSIASEASLARLLGSAISEVQDSLRQINALTSTSGTLDKESASDAPVLEAIEKLLHSVDNITATSELLKAFSRFQAGETVPEVYLNAQTTSTSLRSSTISDPIPIPDLVLQGQPDLHPASLSPSLIPQTSSVKEESTPWTPALATGGFHFGLDIPASPSSQLRASDGMNNTYLYPQNYFASHEVHESTLSTSALSLQPLSQPTSNRTSKPPTKDDNARLKHGMDRSKDLERTSYDSEASLPEWKVVRVQNIPLHQSNSAFHRLLSDLSEPDIQIQADLVPSCTRHDGVQTAIVKFSPRLPDFLSKLAADTVGAGEHSIPIDDDISYTFDKNFFGLTQLYFTDENRDVVADIVAVTGLNGRPFDSWRGKDPHGQMWLQNFFAKDLPCVRTMIYGYNTKWESKGVATADDLVDTLSKELRKARSYHSDRPLILIGHSLGAILVSRLLVHWNYNNRDTFSNSAFKATEGVFFFGAPHRGMDITDMEEMALDLSAEHRMELLQSLDYHSEDKRAAETQKFSQLAGEFKIYSCYELQLTKRLAKTNESDHEYTRSGEDFYPVRKHSAVLGLPQKLEEQIGIDSDHSNMVKFSSPADQTYQTILQELLKLVGSAISPPPFDPREISFMPSLSSMILPQHSPSLSPPNFVFQFRILGNPSRITSEPTTSNPDFSNGNEIMMTGLRSPLPETSLFPPGSNKERPANLTLPFFGDKDLETKKVVEDWIRQTYPKSSDRPKFEKGSMFVRGHISSAETPAESRPVDVTFQIINDERDVKRLEQKTKWENVPFVIICFALADDHEDFKESCSKWCERLTKLTNSKKEEKPSLMFLGFSEAESRVRPPDEGNFKVPSDNNGEPGLRRSPILSQSTCKEEAQKWGAQIYLEVAKSNRIARNVLFSTLIGYGTAGATRLEERRRSSAS